MLRIRHGDRISKEINVKVSLGHIEYLQSIRPINLFAHTLKAFPSNTRSLLSHTEKKQNTSQPYFRASLADNFPRGTSKILVNH